MGINKNKLNNPLQDIQMRYSTIAFTLAVTASFANA